MGKVPAKKPLVANVSAAAAHSSFYDMGKCTEVCVCVFAVRLRRSRFRTLHFRHRLQHVRLA